MNRAEEFYAMFREEQSVVWSVLGVKKWWVAQNGGSLQAAARHPDGSAAHNSFAHNSYLHRLSKDWSTHYCFYATHNYTTDWLDKK